MASWAFHKKKLHCRHATGNCRPMEAYLKLVRSIPAYAREDAAHLEGVENLPWRCAHGRITNADSIVVTNRPFRLFAMSLLMRKKLTVR